VVCLSVQLRKHLQTSKLKVANIGKFAIEKTEKRGEPLLPVNHVFLIVRFFGNVDEGLCMMFRSL
jgi:hypothetical protein